MPKRRQSPRQKRRRLKKSLGESMAWSSYRAKLLEFQAPFLRYGKQSQLFRKPNSERADIVNGTIDGTPLSEVEAQIAKYEASNWLVRGFWRIGSRLLFNSIQTKRRLVCFYRAQVMFSDIENIYTDKNPPSPQKLTELLAPVQSASKGLGLFFSLRSPLNKLFKWFKKTKCTSSPASGYGSCNTEDSPPASADSIEPDASHSPAQAADKSEQHDNRQDPPAQAVAKPASITAWKTPPAKTLKPATTLDELDTKHDKASTDLEALLQEQVNRLEAIYKNLRGTSSAKQKALQSEIDASEKLIKKFYRQVVARQFHPDKYQDDALRTQARVYFVALADCSEMLLKRFKEKSTPANIHNSRPEDVIDFLKSLLMEYFHRLEKKFISIEEDSFAPFDEIYTSALKYQGGDEKFDALLAEAATKIAELRASVAQSKTEFEAVKQAAQSLRQYDLHIQPDKIEALFVRYWQIYRSLGLGKIGGPLYILGYRLRSEKISAVHRIDIRANVEAREAKITADLEARAAKSEAAVKTREAKITADAEVRAAKMKADAEVRAAKMKADAEARAAKIRADGEARAAKITAESSRKLAKLEQMVAQYVADKVGQGSPGSDKSEEKETKIPGQSTAKEKITKAMSSPATSSTAKKTKTKAEATAKATKKSSRKSKKKGTAARPTSFPSAFFGAASGSKASAGSTTKQAGAGRRINSEPIKYEPGRFGTLTSKSSASSSA